MFNLTTALLVIGHHYIGLRKGKALFLYKITIYL